MSFSTSRMRAIPLFLLLSACDANRPKPPPTPHDEPSQARGEPASELVSVGKLQLTTGFALGTIRQRYPVDAFAITRLPVTREAYQQCVEAGQCPALDEKCLALSVRLGGVADSPSAPATCVEPAAARSYCSFVGGRLPTISEWLAAARGSEVKRFAWGSELPQCDQHPRASSYYADQTGQPIRPELPACESSPEDREVAKHPAGASPYGIEDVLLTPAELVGGDAESGLGGCSEGTTCVVYGLSPGAIDAVAGIRKVSKDPGMSDLPEPRRDHSFRCAFDGDVK